MEKSTQMGSNRTGIDMSPIDSKTMIQGARDLTRTGPADAESIDAIHRHYLQQAEPIGSVPMPGTMKGALKSAMDKMTGRNPEVLLNKLGERLAFERGGVRLYESAIRKCEALAELEGGATVPMDELRHIRDEELEHFHLLEEAIETLGADPTAQTPDADVNATAASGLMKVVSDPRTSMSQCLEMLLSAELTDSASWELLITLTEGMGLDELTGRFRQALQQENEHVRKVRGWLESAIMAQAGRARTQH